jgi:hypothetical protein
LINVDYKLYTIGNYPMKSNFFVVLFNPSKKILVSGHFSNYEKMRILDQTESKFPNFENDQIQKKILRNLKVKSIICSPFDNCQ